MKKLFVLFTLVAVLCGLSVPVYADYAAPAVETAAAVSANHHTFMLPFRDGFSFWITETQARLRKNLARKGMNHGDRASFQESLVGGNSCRRFCGPVFRRERRAGVGSANFRRGRLPQPLRAMS